VGFAKSVWDILYLANKMVQLTPSSTPEDECSDSAREQNQAVVS
jgi:hypothetical protein